MGFDDIKIPFRFQIINNEFNETEQTLVLTLASTITINDITNKYQCLLKHCWKTIKVVNDHFIHIFNPRIEPSMEGSDFIKTLIVDSTSGVVIIEPDVLISTTQLMTATFCMRKAWLSKLFQPYGDYSKALIIGTLVHDLFQECIKRNYNQMEQIETLFNKELLPDRTLDLYSLNMSQANLIEEVRLYLKPIADWLSRYAVKDVTNEFYTFHSLHDIENNVWSSKYGFVGKIDVSLKIYVYNYAKKRHDRFLIPLELKTGKHSDSAQHHGQVVLYLYMMSDKYNIAHANLGEGFLLYLKDNFEMKPIASKQTIFYDLIRIRNMLIQYQDKLAKIDTKNITNLKQFEVNGPEPLTNDRICNNCEHLLDCSLVNKCFEENSSNAKKFELAEAQLSHLRKDDLDFFTKMISLLEIERQFCNEEEKVNYFWNIRSEDCELAGIGLAKMSIKSQAKNIISFERNAKVIKRLPAKLLSLATGVNYSLLIDRRVVISEELVSSRSTYETYEQYCSRLCVVIGWITRFSSDYRMIEISLEKEQISLLNPNLIYRLDFLKNLSNRASVINYSNLLRLMEANSEKARELRDIVINGKFLYFNLNKVSFGNKSFNNIYHSSTLAHLNHQQKKAIVGVLRTKGSLIFGSPGSGKTQTIVALVQVIVESGYTVLLTGFTHVAVDNILIKLVQANAISENKVNFVRIGARRRIHPSLEEYTDAHMTKEWLNKGDIGALETFYQTVPVVGVTCLGISGHPIFNRRTFDFCIVDEASQVFLATSLGPLFLSHNFVLVGDQKQLPPVIKNLFAKNAGLENTLFSRLLGFVKQEDIFSDNAPTISSPQKLNLDTIRVFPLFIQYRMNSVIMDVANRLTYSGKLSCGSPEVERATLETFISSNESMLALFKDSYMWKAINPHLADSFIFLDTDSIAKAAETFIATTSIPIDSEAEWSFSSPDNLIKTIGCVYNSFEAYLIVQVVQTIMSIYKKGNLTEANIGIISPFRRQVHTIRETFGLEFVQQHHLEINTVDQYQGRDKEVIIYSCVKSHVKNDESSPDPSTSSLLREDLIDSELLKDQRRLNVAITRAKRKLIIVGNRQTLNRYEPFKKLFNVLKESQFVKVADYDYDDILNNLKDELDDKLDSTL